MGTDLYRNNRSVLCTLDGTYRYHRASKYYNDINYFVKSCVGVQAGAKLC